VPRFGSRSSIATLSLERPSSHAACVWFSNIVAARAGGWPLQFLSIELPFFSIWLGHAPRLIVDA